MSKCSDLKERCADERGERDIGREIDDVRQAGKKEGERGGITQVIYWISIKGEVKERAKREWKMMMGVKQMGKRPWEQRRECGKGGER